MDVLHPAVWVDDIESMKSFYKDGLGLEHSRDFVGGDGTTNYFLTGESDAEIQFKFVEGEEDSDPEGFDHVAIAVTDIEETIDTLTTEFGSELVRGPTLLEDKNVRIAFVTDPEGYVVELIEQLSE